MVNGAPPIAMRKVLLCSGIVMGKTVHFDRTAHKASSQRHRNRCGLPERLHPRQAGWRDDSISPQAGRRLKKIYLDLFVATAAAPGAILELFHLAKCPLCARAVKEEQAFCLAIRDALRSSTPSKPHVNNIRKF